MNIQKPSLSTNKFSLSYIVATEEVTSDTIVTGHVTRLTQKTYTRFRAFREVVDVIAVSRRLVGSQKQQDSLHALWILKCNVMSVLLSNKTQTRVMAIFPVSRYHFWLYLVHVASFPLKEVPEQVLLSTP